MWSRSEAAHFREVAVAEGVPESAIPPEARAAFSTLVRLGYRGQLVR